MKKLLVIVLVAVGAFSAGVLYNPTQEVKSMWVVYCSSDHGNHRPEFPTKIIGVYTSEHLADVARQNALVPGVFAVYQSLEPTNQVPTGVEHDYSN